ncbi:sensor histidine kinase [Nocardiopsis sp. RSe5-2]|uniref:histidine kinase n=1 Tax=Nocardiopsis endophytica TaxID=3018445 RepID=A0ABT4U3B4_9ACTN|nr:sensor histidine kinase [Nocardiopsis endophytica]MDA2810964.1 sensor histidine kinase [Nocardiopsis endophytica]
MRKRMSLARQLFVLQLAVILSLVGTAAVLVFLEVRRETHEHAVLQVRALASALAELPEVRTALNGPDPSAELQPLAESVGEAAGTDFIVFMAPDRTRYTHPDPERIGEPFVGTVAPALEGRTFTESYEGTLGPSVRAVTPIRGEDGQVEALVSIGILQERIGSEVQRRLYPVVAVSAAALLVAAAGSYAISRRLDRQTLGLGAAEITRMYEHHDAVLRTVREGLLIVSPRGELVLANDQARELLGLGADAEGRRVGDLGLRPPLDALLASGEPADDRLCVYGDRVLVARQERIEKDGRPLGTVTTLRDHTELEALAGELDSVRGFTEALRAQAHESANRLHTVVTMVELGQTERAVEFATVELASAQQLADRLTEAVEEPALAALLLGKAAQAAEKGVELVVTEDSAVTDCAVAARDLVTLVGNLVDNAIDAALAAEPPRRVTVTARSDAGGGLLVRVADSGSGVGGAHLDSIFTRGWTTKSAAGARGQGLGLALVKQVIDRYGGAAEVESGDGAVFTVRLRPQQAPEAPGGQGGPDDRPDREEDV